MSENQQMMRKEIFLLVGQKGSGKSFIGSIFDKHFGIKFIRVEDWAKEIKRDRAVDDEAYLKQVFGEIERGIRASLGKTDRIVFESTGLSEYFDNMLHRLKQDFRVFIIRVYADPDTCLQRVRSRDQAIHINVSDDQVLMINEKVRKRSLGADFSIDNSNKSQIQIIKEVEHIIGQVAKTNR
jgi:dephospho-CoA kinase